jgi:hypothetical protein
MVRVIEYQLKGVEGAEPLYRLITTLTDCQKYPAQELAALSTRSAGNTTARAAEGEHKSK